MIRLFLIFIFSYSAFADSLYAPDYPHTPNDAPSNYTVGWATYNSNGTISRSGSSANQAAAYATFCGVNQWYTADCMANTGNTPIPTGSGCGGSCPSGKTLVCGSGWSVGSCEPGNNPCPYGGHQTQGNLDCQSVPWGQGPPGSIGATKTCSAGATVSMCAPDGGGALVRNEGCVYQPANVSNQWMVNGVQSRCGTWTATGELVDATLHSGTGSATIPTPAELKPYAAAPEENAPPGFEVPVTPPPVADIPPVVPDALATGASESTLAAGFNALMGVMVSVQQSINAMSAAVVDKIGGLGTRITNSISSLGNDLKASIDGTGASNVTAINGVKDSVNALKDEVKKGDDKYGSLNCDGTGDSGNPDCSNQVKTLSQFAPGTLTEGGSCPSDKTFSAGGHTY